VSSQQELFQAVLSEMEPKLSHLGFILNRRDQQYTRVRPGKKEAFHLADIKHRDDFDIVADIGIRFDAVENLLDEFRTDLSARDKAKTYTIGVEMGNLMQGKRIRWSVRDQRDVPIVSAAIVRAFDPIALPYFSRLSSLEDILPIVSHDGPEAWLHAPLHGDRAQTAIAIAFLLDQKHTFNQLVEDKTRYLTERHESGLAQFKGAAQSLSERWSTSQGQTGSSKRR